MICKKIEELVLTGTFHWRSILFYLMILTDFSNAIVWIISIFPMISKYSKLLTKLHQHCSNHSNNEDHNNSLCVPQFLQFSSMA